MARRICCPHCTAPHRLVGGQTRFTCDYCRSLVVAEGPAGVHELVVPEEPNPKDARAVAMRWLRRKGVHSPLVVMQELHYEPLWVVCSTEGREHLVLGNEEGIKLLRNASVPAVSLVPRRKVDRGPSFRKPSVSQADAEQAALATFESEPIESVRLLWIPVVPLRARTAGGWVSGVYIGGADQVRFEPLPTGARDAPVSQGVITAFLVVLSVAVLAGLLLPTTPRAVVEGALVLGAVLLWKPLMQSLGSGGTSS